MKSRCEIIFIIAIYALISGCATSYNERDKNELASATTKLSSAVDAVVRFRNPLANTAGPELLARATARDPELLTPFDNFSIHVQREGRNSAVLICNRDNTRALFEDAGCTARLDLNYWERLVPVHCASTLNLSAICEK